MGEALASQNGVHDERLAVWRDDVLLPVRRVAVLPTFVANNPSGAPGSTVCRLREKRIGTAMSRSSAPT